MARVPDCRSGGCGFESRRPRSEKEPTHGRPLLRQVTTGSSIRRSWGSSQPGRSGWPRHGAKHCCPLCSHTKTASSEFRSLSISGPMSSSERISAPCSNARQASLSRLCRLAEFSLTCLITKRDCCLPNTRRIDLRPRAFTRDNVPVVTKIVSERAGAFLINRHGACYVGKRSEPSGWGWKSKLATIATREPNRQIAGPTRMKI